MAGASLRKAAPFHGAGSWGAAPPGMPGADGTRSATARRPRLYYGGPAVPRAPGMPGRPFCVL